MACAWSLFEVALVRRPDPRPNANPYFEADSNLATSHCEKAEGAETTV